MQAVVTVVYRLSENLGMLENLIAQTYRDLQIVNYTDNKSLFPLKNNNLVYQDEFCYACLNDFLGVKVITVAFTHAVNNSQAKNHILKIVGERTSHYLFMPNDTWQLHTTYTESLINKLDENYPFANIAYADWSINNTIEQRMEPFDRIRLLNFTQLFVGPYIVSRNIANEYRFDESLDTFEDYFFFIGASNKTVALHIPKVLSDVPNYPQFLSSEIDAVRGKVAKLLHG